MRYDFNYTVYQEDREDTYQSNGHSSLQDALNAYSKLVVRYDGQVEMSESWVYDEDGNHLGDF